MSRKVYCGICDQELKNEDEVIPYPGEYPTVADPQPLLEFVHKSCALKDTLQCFTLRELDLINKFRKENGKDPLESDIDRSKWAYDWDGNPDPLLGG